MDELKQNLEECRQENSDLKSRLEDLRSETENLRRENSELRKKPAETESLSARVKKVVEENNFLRALISNLRAEIQAVRSAFVRQTQAGKDSQRRCQSRSNCTPRPERSEDQDDEAIEASLEGNNTIAAAPRAWAWGGAEPPRRGGAVADEKNGGGSDCKAASNGRARSLSASADSNTDNADLSRAGSQKDLGSQKTTQQQGANSGVGTKVMPRPLPLWKTRVPSTHHLHAAVRELSPPWSSRSAPPRSLSAQLSSRSRHASPQPQPVGSPVSSRPPSRPASRPASRSPSPQAVRTYTWQAPRPHSVMVKVRDLPSQRSPEGKEIRREHWRMFPAQQAARQAANRRCSPTLRSASKQR